MGLVFSTIAFALLTAAGMCFERYSAAAALWALCLGDGVGGAFGRRLGRHSFSVPGGKRKSLEGSAAVALFAAAGVALAGAHLRLTGRRGQKGVCWVVASFSEKVAPPAREHLHLRAAVLLRRG